MTLEQLFVLHWRELAILVVKVSFVFMIKIWPFLVFVVGAVLLLLLIERLQRWAETKRNKTICHQCGKFLAQIHAEFGESLIQEEYVLIGDLKNDSFFVGFHKQCAVKWATINIPSEYYQTHNLLEEGDKERAIQLIINKLKDEHPSMEPYRSEGKRKDLP